MSLDCDFEPHFHELVEDDVPAGIQLYRDRLLVAHAHRGEHPDHVAVDCVRHLRDEQLLVHLLELVQYFLLQELEEGDVLLGEDDDRTRVGPHEHLRGGLLRTRNVLLERDLGQQLQIQVENANLVVVGDREDVLLPKLAQQLYVQELLLLSQQFQFII